jgi:hypothetical protein
MGQICIGVQKRRAWNLKMMDGVVFAQKEKTSILD